MEGVKYLVKESGMAEITVDGVSYKFRVPPVKGAHYECFGELYRDQEVRAAQGKEIAVYATGALDANRQNEWLDPRLILFPSEYSCLRIPVVLTFVPKKRKFGELQGGMLVDPSLEGRGRRADFEELKNAIPKDLDGWSYNGSSLFVKGDRVFVPHDRWFKKQWDENNGAAIACFGREGAEMLAKIGKDAGLELRLETYDFASYEMPESTVPIIGYFADIGCGFELDLTHRGADDGACAVAIYRK